MLRHRTESHIHNSFVQTFIVLLVALVTFFFDLDDFSDRIMVNAVLLLAMATITSSIQEVWKMAEVSVAVGGSVDPTAVEYSGHSGPEG